MAGFEIDGHLGLFHAGEVLDHASALRAIENAVRNEDFLECSGFLWDFSDAECRLDTDELKNLVEAYRQQVPKPQRNRKIALVGKAPATRSILLILRSMLDSHRRVECRQFDRPQSARVWLAARAAWTGKFDVPGVKALLQETYPVKGGAS